MENDKVKDLLEIMENHNLSEISLNTGWIQNCHEKSRSNF